MAALLVAEIRLIQLRLLVCNELASLHGSDSLRCAAAQSGVNNVSTGPVSGEGRRCGGGGSLCLGNLTLDTVWREGVVTRFRPAVKSTHNKPQI